ncbi:putative mannitol dehydrogenase [Hibiscus syriacus]|uniref:cinnamyl-alcohol dehydrogenase n=1 Tax=Hibiscus syriacus TaxID=106335 RepID=A0A6A3ANX4_HIBSY|nr:putative mannitol dehydrogenase [Hibiscus syriacus]
MAKSPEEEHPKKAFGWAARDCSGVLSPFKFSRRATGDKDVAFKVLYCGMCHSDIHMVKNEWGDSIYPLVPGHEIVGEVTEVGRFRSSKSETESASGAWSIPAVPAITAKSISRTSVPKCLPLDAAAPLLCAGITVYSPMKHYGLDKPGRGIEKLLVLIILVSRDQDQLKAAFSPMDGIIDTVSAQHPMKPLFQLLKTDGKIALVGLPEHPFEVPASGLIIGRKIIGGSMIGGMKETQEMMDFAAKHNVRADIEVVAMDYVNTAVERILKSDVKYRFVIDIGNTLKPPS